MITRQLKKYISALAAKYSFLDRTHYIIIIALKHSFILAF